jgi:hypothetical protein
MATRADPETLDDGLSDYPLPAPTTARAPRVEHLWLARSRTSSPAPGPSRAPPPGPPKSQTPSQDTWLGALHDDDEAGSGSSRRPRRMSDLADADILDLGLSPPPAAKRRRTSPDAPDIEILPLPSEPLPLARKRTPPPVPSAPEPLAAYACPVCFTPPTRATLLPCGHVCCGECVFAAVKTMQRRNQYAPDAHGVNAARCVRVYTSLGVAHRAPGVQSVARRSSAGTARAAASSASSLRSCRRCSKHVP